MIVSINQPAYLPWLGYFQRIAASDLHIVLDHVQFEKNSFINRNKVKTANEWCWLTVPVKTKGNFGNLPINQLEIDNRQNWQKKHWNTFCQNYSKAPHFKKHSPFFESIYQYGWNSLSELCYELTSYLLKSLGITTPLVYSSDMNITGVKDELILELSQKVNADTYFSGILGNKYLREELFEEAGIEIFYQNYHHPIYPQCQGKKFEPYMSIVDLLFNCGSDSLEIIMSGEEKIKR